jgi:hypothetical protein
MLICQHHQIILRLLSSAAMPSTWWRVRELCLTTYTDNSKNVMFHIFTPVVGIFWYVNSSVHRNYGHVACKERGIIPVFFPVAIFMYKFSAFSEFLLLIAMVIWDSSVSNAYWCIIVSVIVMKIWFADILMSCSL